jgi:hypothetical protein
MGRESAGSDDGNLDYRSLFINYWITVLKESFREAKTSAIKVEVWVKTMI